MLSEKRVQVGGIIINYAMGPPRRAMEVFGADHSWFAFQAQNLHQLDPDVLTAVLAGPEAMLAGYEPARLLPAITCPVLLLPGDPAAGGLLRDEEVRMGLHLLPQATHVQLVGIGHELHGPPANVPRVLEVIQPFLEAVRPPFRTRSE